MTVAKNQSERLPNSGFDMQDTKGNQKDQGDHSLDTLPVTYYDPVPLNEL